MCDPPRRGRPPETAGNPPRARRPGARSVFLLPLLLMLPIFTTCDPLGSTGPDPVRRLCSVETPPASPVTCGRPLSLPG